MSGTADRPIAWLLHSMGGAGARDVAARAGSGRRIRFRSRAVGQFSEAVTARPKWKYD